MTTMNFGKKIGGAILGVVVLFGVGMISSSTAQAQYPTYNQRQQDRNRGRGDDRNDRNRGRDNDRWNDNGDRRNDGYRNYGGTFELRQTALNAGFNEGMKEGRKDRSHGDRYDYRDEGAYQKATNDYSSRLGDRGIYQRYFRDAFENGYKAGYQGY